MMPFAFQIPYDRKAEITNAVKEAFIGYIGNEEAVYAIERDLLLALASDPPKLTRAFLLWGPSSAGKTEMAKRIEIRDEVEPFLLRMGFVTSTERGRLITLRGRMVVDEFEGEQ